MLFLFSSSTTYLFLWSTSERRACSKSLRYDKRAADLYLKHYIQWMHFQSSYKANKGKIAQNVLQWSEDKKFPLSCSLAKLTRTSKTPRCHLLLWDVLSTFLHKIWTIQLLLQGSVLVLSVSRVCEHKPSSKMVLS